MEAGPNLEHAHMAEKTAKTNPFEQWMAQATELQTKMIETSFKTMTELHSEWSKASVEASRKAMELFAR